MVTTQQRVDSEIRDMYREAIKRNREKRRRRVTAWVVFGCLTAIALLGALERHG